MGMERMYGVSQIFIKPGSDGSVELILVKITDDVMLEGSIDAMKSLVEKIRSRFEISK